MNFFQRLFRKKVKEDPDFPSQAKKLPGSCPPDLEIQISRGGTHVMFSERIIVSRNNLITQKSLNMTGAEFKCGLPPSVIENLFLILKKNRFDEIKIKEEIRLDYPSNHIHVNWRTYYISKGESQTELMDNKSGGNYENCYFELLGEIKRGMGDHTKKIKVKIPDEMFAAENWFTISCKDPLTHYYYSNHKITYSEDFSTSTDVPNGPPEDISALPAYSEFEIRFEKKGSKKLKNIVEFPEGDYGTITFYEENNELRWKLS